MPQLHSVHAILAQSAPPTQETLAGGSAAAPGTTLAPGVPAGAPTASRAPDSPFGGSMLLIIVVVFGALLLFSMTGQRKERKKREAMINALKKHDRVQTIGGVIGSVVEIKPNTVVLKVDESSNTRITFSRSAIQQVLDSSPDPETAAAQA